MGRPAYLAGLIGLVAIALAACSGDDDRGGPASIRVLAAASTAGALDEVADRFESATGVRVARSYAGSGTLARQIEHGAPADVFVSAHPMWVEHLRTRNLLVAPRPLLTNRLVVVAPADHAPPAFTPTPGMDLAAALPGRIAIGDPAHVPAGIYAQQALRRLGAWEATQPRLVTTRDVRAAVRLVEIGEADAAIVYATDALASDALSVVATIPADWHDPIEYTVALCTGAGEEAAAFVAFLETPESLGVFEARGFTRPSTSESGIRNPESETPNP